TKVTSGKTWYYKVQALDAYTTSVMSDAVMITTPLTAPATLTASAVGGWINLSWTGKDSAATGYTILRPTDGVNYSTLKEINSLNTTSYADIDVDAGTTYYYGVRARNDSLTSAVSNIVSMMAPTGGSGGNITITTRYTNELVITATGTSDSISLSQS